MGFFFLTPPRLDVYSQKACQPKQMHSSAWTSANAIAFYAGSATGQARFGALDPDKAFGYGCWLCAQANALGRPARLGARTRAPIVLSSDSTKHGVLFTVPRPTTQFIVSNASGYVFTLGSNILKLMYIQEKKPASPSKCIRALGQAPLQLRFLLAVRLGKRA